MFRDGQYLEVIKASNNCLATAVVTVQEKTIELKKKKVSTNKWLNLEDWAALYKILEKALIRNSQSERCRHVLEGCEWRKSTRQLEITYTIESSECLKDITSLPTIRVNVSPARKKTEKQESQDRTSEKEKGESQIPKIELHDRISERSTAQATERTLEDTNDKFSKKLDNQDILITECESKTRDKSQRYVHKLKHDQEDLEEYVPDALTVKKHCSDFNYVPSKKSTLESMQIPSNEYTPTHSDNKNAAEVIRYIPNSVGTFEPSYEIYEPSAPTVPIDLSEQYVPNSKGMKTSVEEYHPDFTSKSMKFDNSYVPSSVQNVNGSSKRSSEKLEKLKLQRLEMRRKRTLTKKKMSLFF